MTVKHVKSEHTEYDVYAIREIFYSDDGLIGYTDPVEMYGDEPHEVMKDLELMALVSEHPIFNVDTKEWIDWPKEEEREPADEEG